MESYIAMGFPDGDVKAFPSEEYHEKCKEKHPDVTGWVWATAIDEALSSCHAAFQARLKSVAGGESIAAAAFFLEEFLDGTAWELDDSEVIGRVKLLHDFIKEAEEESPLNDLVEWSNGDRTTWLNPNEEAPDDSYEKVVAKKEGNPDQLSLI